MPNIASAKKNMRKSRAATVRNRAQRSALRTALKKAKAPGASTEVKLAAAKLRAIQTGDCRLRSHGVAHLDEAVAARMPGRPIFVDVCRRHRTERRERRPEVIIGCREIEVADIHFQRLVLPSLGNLVPAELAGRSVILGPFSPDGR